MRLPLLLSMSIIALAADPVAEVVLDRDGSPVRIVVDGTDLEVVDGATGLRSSVRDASVSDRAGVVRAAGRWRAAHPAARVEVAGTVADTGQRVVITRQVAVRIPDGSDRTAYLAAHGLRLVEALDFAPGTVLAEAVADDPLAGVDAAAMAVREGAWAEAQVRMPRSLKHVPADPLFAQQWHLLNSGDAGEDINVVGAWDSVTGAGVNVAVVDDGVELTHPDLSGAFRTDIDRDVYSGDDDPSNTPTDEGHGTAVAGLIGAREANGAGGTGVAYGSAMIGVRLLGSGSTTDTQDATALAFRSSSAVADAVFISNNSWGPNDDGQTIGGVGSLAKQALATGTTAGRAGRGTVYVVAGGNGRWRSDAQYDAVDNADYDSFATNRYTIGVAAIRPDGVVADYSERGCGLLLCAPGGDFGGMGIVTTDRVGSNGFVPGAYTAASDDIAGTSFAAPIVSGGVALVLQARPVLSWRDVPHVLARTARQNDPTSGEWAVNGAGIRFHPDYGAGCLDVGAAVSLARTWVPLPAETSSATVTSSASSAIPDNSLGGTGRNFDLSALAADFVVERTQVTVNLTHANRGQVRFQLISPDGTVSTFEERPYDTAANLSNWTFTTVRCLGERGQGTWSLVAMDVAAGTTGTLGTCSLRLFGYRPYAAATSTTAVFPSAALVGQGATVISVTGSGMATSQGGDVVAEVAVDGQSATQAGIDATGGLSATLPGSAFASAGTLTVRIANPQVPGADSSGDTGGGASAGSVTITVRAANLDPVAGSNNAPATITAGHAVSGIAVSWSDPDGDTMRYSIVSGPSHGTATIDALTGAVTYTADGGYAGSDAITVRATDGMTTTDSVIPLTIVSGGGGGGSSGGGGGGGGGGCGAGAAGLLLGSALFALGIRRRRRR